MASRKKTDTAAREVDGHTKAWARKLLMSGGADRFTQDSPILPDVWQAYLEDPNAPQDLLLTPHHQSHPGALACALRKRLKDYRDEYGIASRSENTGGRERVRVAQMQSMIGARVYFDELVCVALPMTRWWQQKIRGNHLLKALNEKDNSVFLEDYERWRAGRVVPDPEVYWLAHVVGTIAMLGEIPDKLKDLEARLDVEQADTTLPLARLLDRTLEVSKADRDQLVHLFSRSRPVQRSVYRSSMTIKADAGRRLFDIRCHKLRWAVIDTGIDALHPAFLDPRALADVDSVDELLEGERLKTVKHSRVRKTFDFTFVARLLDPDTPDEELPQDFVDSLGGANSRRRRWRTDLKGALTDGRDVEWQLVESLLEIPADAYVAPTRDHGTHVAGILGADERPALGDVPGALVGVCPDIELYDLRVFPDPDADPEGNNEDGDEFGLIAALQFVRYLNAKSDYRVLHGVNLSLSVPHNVVNYACGRTPVCEECNRVSAEGIVVVAAAGNKAFTPVSADTDAYGSYSDTNVTDPGNADAVITVGATHRTKPHVYGVSFFSSRGPTGDGRSKPDLVAPGEKIEGPSLNGGHSHKEGTSMAAPHVSGAAAMLMARHPELIGDPARIKQVLCDTATDLGRERYFQGAGLLDVLRALQSL